MRRARPSQKGRALGQMPGRLRRTGRLALWVALVLALAVTAGCNPSYAPGTPQPEQSQRAPTQTVLANELRGTLTAKAPTATNTPLPTPTDTPLPPTPTATPEPTATVPEPEVLPVLAYVRVGEGQTANLVIRDLATGEERVLTHFAEPLGIYDLEWSPDGTSLVFVSAHNYLASRCDERNVFVVQHDGTDLRMVTGESMPPSEASGPFVSVSGVISGPTTSCYVSAQGVASPATTNGEGEFTLAGVPETSSWVRAVCAPPVASPDAPQGGEDETLAITAYQGAISFSEGVSIPLTITLDVAPRGAGWHRASLAPEGDRFCGIRDSWALSEDGEPVYQSQAVIYDLNTHETVDLELPEEAQIQDVAWSPNGDRIAGAYRLDQGSYVALWDTSGRPLESLLEIEDTDSVIMTVKQVRWSRDGSHLAYAQHQHYWWENPTYKTELWTLAVAEPTPQLVAEMRWGEHATNPSWTADGETLFYQFIRGAGNDPTPDMAEASLRSIRADGTGRPNPLLAGDNALLPAAHPLCPMNSTRPEFRLGNDGP